MDPVSLIFGFGMLFKALGAGVQASGQMKAGQYESLLAEKNQQLAELSASDAIARGESDANRARWKGAAVGGEQAAVAAASGVDESSGSPLRMMADTKVMSELDAQTIKANAAREAWGYKVQGWNYGEQAKMSRQRSGQAAFSTLLGAAGDIASDVANWPSMNGASLKSAYRAPTGNRLSLTNTATSRY